MLYHLWSILISDIVIKIITRKSHGKHNIIATHVQSSRYLTFKKLDP